MSLKFVRQEGAETLYICPDCGKPKLSWNASRGLGRCFTCDKGYNELTFGRLLGRELAAAQPSVNWRRPKPSAGYVEAWEDPRCRAYMLSRGVGREVTEACGALYADDQVHFPVWSPFGAPPMLMRRSILPGEKGWRSFPANKAGYLFGERPSGNSTIILAEGIFGILTPGLWGHGFALLGKTATFDMLNWLVASYKKIILWLDPDKPGREGAEHVERLLYELEVNRFVDIKYDKEPGDCTVDEAKEVLQTQASYTYTHKLEGSQAAI